MGTIKSWAEDDKPREKFLHKGKSVLSDVELVAILLRSGSAKLNALEVARLILQKANNDLNNLGKLSVKQLCEIEGVGPVKAITLLAAIELGGRKQGAEQRINPKFTSSRDAYLHFKHKLEDLAYEEFWVLNLARNNTLISESKISEGGVSATVVDPKKVFNFALTAKASAIILCHNHPSGNLEPSKQDIDLTTKIKQAAQLLEIQVLDHIIVAGKSYYSFADEGLL
jgi:DNA repair protein RadC